MRFRALARIVCFFLWCVSMLAGAQAQEELLRTTSEAGNRGGNLVIAQRSEPRTFNPVTAVDQNSFGVNARMQADLIHINRVTQKTEPALAKSLSPDVS